MKAQQLQLKQFLVTPKTQFVIPIYQRNYDWRTTQCEQLLNDIIEAGKNNQQHFVGSIVFIYDGYGHYLPGGANELIIIDGQQRLTTITLLYIALYHYAIDNGQDRLADEIYEECIINKFVDNEHKLKLKPTENNDIDLKALINRTAIDAGNRYSRIIDNYNYFRNYIKNNQNDIEWILAGLEMLMFVEISLDRNYDNAQRIFESLNSTGLDLSEADLIRNYILMDRTASEQKELYSQYWEYIEQNTRIGEKNNLPDFIRDYLTYSKERIANKNEVYHTFKKEFQIHDIAGLKTLLSDIKRLAQPYGKLLDPDKEQDKEIRKELNNINQLEINTSYPFLMKVYDDYINGVIGKDCFVRILRFIQTFAFRRFILDLPTNTLNKIFMSLYREIDQSNYEESLYRHIMRLKGRQRMPNDMEIRAAIKDKDFYNSKPKNKYYLFENLENWGNKELYVDISGNGNITIEHIFPRTPAQEWHNDLTKEDYADFSQKYLHTMGNLTLSGNNNAMGNKTFLAKRDMNQNNGEQGYAYSKLWLNQDLGQLSAWNVEEYKKRTLRLTNRFLEIWSLPHIDGLYENESELSDNGEVNIFEADDPVGKTLEYARFFNTPVKGINDSYISYAALYLYVAKKVFEVTPEDFIVKLGNALSVSTSKSELRRPKPLNDTYFIDVNLSSSEIFKRIKLILTTFNLEDELLIKYNSANEDLNNA